MVHLKAGDPEPVIVPSKYTILGNRFCPFTYRVKLVLDYHQLNYDIINISLDEKPEWLQKLSPSGKVPILLHEGDKLVESDLIMRFLDEQCDEKTSLFQVCGEDQFIKAGRLAGKFFKPAHSIIYNSEYSQSDVSDYRQACQEINDSIKDLYFSGNKLSLADLIIFPQLDRLEVAESRIKNVDVNLVSEYQDANEHSSWPVLVNYLTRMRQLPFIVQSRESSVIQSRFAETKRANHSDLEIF